MTQDKIANLVGQLARHYDPSGRTETVRRDFKGNVQELHRILTRDATVSVVKWDVADDTALNGLLEQETYVQLTEHAALNRMTRLYNWHRPAQNRVAIHLPRYNWRGLLEAEGLVIRATGYDPTTGTRTTAIQEIRYNAKGQKEYLELGNGTLTQYDYDPLTFRIRQLRTTRPANADEFPKLRSNLTNPNVIQQLLYTYDPVGNITEMQDQAYKPVFFSKAIVEPKNLYEYDALYRLIHAMGRENGTTGGVPSHMEGNAPETDFPITDPSALRKYTQIYAYDSVGNIKRMAHQAGPTGSWTRDYAYAFEDPMQPASNRLWQTWTGGDRTQAITYGYDTHGNMLNLANVAPGQDMQWDHRDMIKRLNLVGGGIAYYQYDAGKQRTRKYITRIGGALEDRIYLGGYELYRRRNSQGNVVEEIESLHLFEGEQRVLLVDDVITAKSSAQPGLNGLRIKEQTLFRYQYSNHLGSACLELDDQAAIISYEEYHPYGTSAYRAMKRDSEAPAKRYRYTGIERDEESGLSYHWARHFTSWLCRWASPDPANLKDGVNVYRYCRNSPLGGVDRNGHQTKTRKQGVEGDVNRHGSQGSRGQKGPTTNTYELESEHIDPFGAQRENMRNQATGESPIPKGRGGRLDRNQTTVLLDKSVSDAKTAFDRPLISNAQKEALNGGVIPSTAAELGPDAAMDRLKAASEAAGRTVPKGAYLAQAGQIDSLHADPDVRAFSRSPENNVLAGATDAEIDAALNIPETEARAGNFVKDIPGTKNPRASTVFQGNFGSSKSLGTARNLGGIGLGGASVAIGVYSTVVSAESGDVAGTVVNATLVSAEGTGLLISAAGLLAGDAATVSAGAFVSGVAGAVGLAVGGVALAIDEGSRAAAGKKTGAVEATEFYADLVNEGEKQGGAWGS